MGDRMRTERRTLLKFLGTAAVALWIGGASLAQPALAAEKVTVFAAASLKNALDAVDAEWKKESGKETTVSYAASSALAKQIESGAPADVFISADLAWMDYVSEKTLIKDDTRANLLGNRIVLVTGKKDAGPVDIKQGLDLKALLGDEKLAMGAVDSVPAGNTARPHWKSSVSGRPSKRTSPALKTSGLRFCSSPRVKRPMASSIRRMPLPTRM